MWAGGGGTVEVPPCGALNETLYGGRDPGADSGVGAVGDFTSGRRGLRV